MRGLIFFLFSPLLLAQNNLVEKTSTLSVNVRMVEVYASVLDQHGKHVHGLTADNFEVVEDGQPQKIRLFEPESAALTAALLIDTTGSMLKDLPHVKNAVSTLLTLMKPVDSFGLFSFNTRLTTIQPFTQDRAGALRAMMRTRAAGTTALFDALTQLSLEVSRLNGKKVILLFTDGADNASVVPKESAVRNIKKVGVPVYAVAQGEALTSRSLMQSLTEICTATGGMVFPSQEGRSTGHHL